MIFRQLEIIAQKQMAISALMRDSIAEEQANGRTIIADDLWWRARCLEDQVNEILLSGNTGIAEAKYGPPDQRRLPCVACEHELLCDCWECRGCGAPYCEMHTMWYRCPCGVAP